MTTGSGKNSVQTRTRPTKEVMKAGNENAGWQTMNIKPLEDDVKGTLEATVTYYDNTGRPLVTNTKDLPKKEIVVRGIGTPVNVTKVKTLTGYSTTPDEPPIDGDQLPTSSSIKMDAYREKIDNFTVKPVGPWQYELKLHMGAKNGTAQYATVEVSGDTDAVTLQTVTDGGQPVDYKPKDKILNPLVNDKGPKAGTVNLLINANPQPADSSQRRAKLTISFYLVGQSKPSSKNSLLLM